MAAHSLSLRTPRRSAGMLCAALALAAFIGCSGNSDRAGGGSVRATRSLPTSPLRGIETPAAPGAARGNGNAPGGEFYPLVAGNRWRFHQREITTISSFDSSGAESTTFSYEYNEDFESELLCNDVIDGVSYLFQRDRYLVSPDTIDAYSPLRQDAGGLYLRIGPATSIAPPCAGGPAPARRGARAEIVRFVDRGWDALAARIIDPARRAAYHEAWSRLEGRLSSAAGGRGLASLEGGAGSNGALGALEGEATVLSYPIHPHARWRVATLPDGSCYEAIVEAEDGLDLPVGHVPAYRLRWKTPFDGLRDFTYFWYGRSGLLRSRQHFEGIATDPYGRPIGKIVAELSTYLVDLTLGRGRFAERGAGAAASLR